MAASRPISKRHFNPEVALREMARVVQPGGSALAFDFDSDLTVVDVPDWLLVRRIADVLDAAVPHPWIGRQLFGLFRRIGLVDVRVVPHVVCLSGASGFGFTGVSTRGRSPGLRRPARLSPPRPPNGGRAWSGPQRRRRFSRQISASSSPGESSKATHA
jgi:hypothetical protein